MPPRQARRTPRIPFPKHSVLPHVSVSSIYPTSDVQPFSSEYISCGCCSPAHYGFGYEVNGDYATFGHQEQREGDYTKGVYHVDLPDGRKQVVNYHVEGDSGE